MTHRLFALRLHLATFPVLPASSTERKGVKELAKYLFLKMTSPSNVELEAVATAIAAIHDLTSPVACM